MGRSGFLTGGFSTEMVDFQSTMIGKWAKKKGPPSPATPSMNPCGGAATRCSY
jgi:hypothetical protein